MLKRPVLSLCMVVLFTVQPDADQGRSPRMDNSDPIAMLGFAALARYGILDAIDKCPSRECGFMKEVDRLFESEPLIDGGKSLLFIDDVWTFDFEAVGSTVGRRTGTTPVSSLFVSQPVVEWNGDIIVIISSTAPQRLSIIRVGSLHQSAKPTMSVLFDSVKKPDLLADEVAVGDIAWFEVAERGTLLVRERSMLGTRSAKSGRLLLLRITKAGLNLTVRR